MSFNISKEDYSIAFSSGRSSFLQSWEWGEVKRPAWKPFRTVIQNIPITILVRSIPLIGKKFGYLGRPVNDKNVSDELIKSIVQFSDEIGLSFVFIDPEIQREATDKTLLDNGFVRYGPQRQIENTNVIDLSGGVETLWSSLSSNTRNKCNKPRKLGCEVEMFAIGDVPIARFWKIMDSVVQNTSYVAHGESYFRKVWEIMSEADMARIFIMKDTERDLGTYFCIKKDERLWELYGGLNSEGRAMRGAGYFLKWESIQLASLDGVTYYDQWGVAPKIDGKFDLSHSLARIGEFKEEFGGLHVEYLDQYVLVNDKMTYEIFKMIEYGQAINVKLRKLIKR